MIAFMFLQMTFKAWNRYSNYKINNGESIVLSEDEEISLNEQDNYDIYELEIEEDEEKDSVEDEFQQQ